MRNLATNMIIHGQLKLIKERAKILQPLVENLITWAKSNKTDKIEKVLFKIKIDPKAKKSINAFQFLIHDLAPRYKERNGGYTRIIN